MTVRGTFCERGKAPKSAFDPKSFRWVKSGKARVLVGCPRGEWSKTGRCKVSMRAYKVLAPVTKSGRCKAGRRISK